MKTRILTIGAACVDSQRRPVPELRIRAEWLADLGFTPGIKVIVQEQPGVLSFSTLQPTGDYHAAMAKFQELGL